MNIYQCLKKDHDQVNRLFDQISFSKSQDERQDLFAEMKKELLLHSETEDATFYATLRERGELKDIIDHAKEEHDKVKSFLEKLEKMSPESEK